MFFAGTVKPPSLSASHENHKLEKDQTHREPLLLPQDYDAYYFFFLPSLLFCLCLYVPRSLGQVFSPTAVAAAARLGWPLRVGDVLAVVYRFFLFYSVYFTVVCFAEPSSENEVLMNCSSTFIKRKQCTVR